MPAVFRLIFISFSYIKVSITKMSKPLYFLHPVWEISGFLFMVRESQDFFWKVHSFLIEYGFSNVPPNMTHLLLAFLWEHFEVHIFQYALNVHLIKHMVYFETADIHFSCPVFCGLCDKNICPNNGRNHWIHLSDRIINTLLYTSFVPGSSSVYHSLV